MNWIIIVIVILLSVYEEYMASPTPLKLPGHTRKLTPYIKHWEAANFDRNQLHEANEKHIEQKRHRRKRHLRLEEYMPANIIQLNFSALDREFRLVLRQDPLSVFASDVHIENTEGLLHYDISRVYTGKLEDDDNSYVHAVLTDDNLLDGTIETFTEHFYIEPSHRYSNKLNKSGIHSIIYKVSDVDMRRSKTFTESKKMPTTAAAEHCASERLKRSTLFDQMKRRISNGEEFRFYPTPWKSLKATERAISGEYQRVKRWLPDDELSLSHGTPKGDPPLPLDLEVPYTDDLIYYSNIANTKSTLATTIRKATITTTRNPYYLTNSSTINNIKEQSFGTQPASVITWQNTGITATISPTTIATITTANTIFNKYNRNRNIIIKNFNTSNNSNDENLFSFNYNNNNNNNNDNANVNDNDNDNNNHHYRYNINNSNNNNNVRKTYTKHKNIIVSTYSNNNNNHRSSFNNRDNEFIESIQNGGSSGSSSSSSSSSNLYNNNWTTIFMGGSNDRPIHKTHVEIITKNGATKKPNIIVNNYNPDIVMAPNPHNPNFNSMLMTNLLTNRGSKNPTDSINGNGSNGKSSYDRKITCMLYLQADHTFFQKMGSDEASIEAITRHVQRANSIYKNTDFNNDGKPDNITFMIKRIKVHNMNAMKDPSYRFPGNYGVEKFLELFSEEDYDAFCLAYMFTYRDFEMGTLGLAWTGDLKNAGGVCEKNGHYRGSLKSLNTGIVTLLNYGKHVPPAVSHVTLAHEIGHNFGSPHDPEQCTPGGEDGNYIMFARATSGDKKNNNKFSPCSLKSIEPVLNAKARSSKGCFTEPQTSICGNGVVEPGEQCDCGWEEDCKDTCCFPMSRHPRNGEKPCTLTPKSMCSPSQGPCCTSDCTLKLGDKCRDDNGCRDPSFCNGRMPHCPPSINKPNKTICNKEFVCFMGECTGSICLAYGLESCQCIPGPKDNKIKSCELCCKLPGEDNPCRSSFEWNEPPFDVPDMFAKPGTPCNDYNGYCDVFQKCREVDPSGPLATLRKLLLSEESIATFKKWIQQNWYTVALAGLGVFVLLIISTKLLAKRSNLKLKSVTIIHSATTETVRLPEDNNGIIVHTAVRTKVPFKKKVRGERNANSNNNNNSTNIGSKSKITPKTTATGISPTVTATTIANINTNKNITKITKNPLKGSVHAATTTAITPTNITNRAMLKKSMCNKVSKRSTTANSVNPLITTQLENVKGENVKKLKKSKKSNKEIIDYSSIRGGRTNSSFGVGSQYNNTLSRVHKWLLESPIVAQPLSHIEHASKVRKVMNKSQSTPERLVQKAPIKSKSTGNLNNDKVKLQVVYKPPFKFALRFSKNSKLKTHIIGNNQTKRTVRTVLVKESKRCTSSQQQQQRCSTYVDDVGNGTQATDIGTGNAVKSLGEKTKRAALLLRGNNAEDNQILTLNEPNYETLNPQAAPTKLENPFYENVNYLKSPAKRNSEPNVINHKSQQSSNGSFKVANAELKTNTNKLNLSSYNNESSTSQGSNAIFTYHHYQLLSANNCMDESARQFSKLSETNINELGRNFGSTQNLIQSPPPTHSNTKTKKRSSLNLKMNATKNAKDPPTKRSNSNMHLRGVDKFLEPSIVSTSSAKTTIQQPLRRSSSSTTHQYHQQRQQQLQLPLQLNDISQPSTTIVMSKSSLLNCLPSVADTTGQHTKRHRVTQSSFTNIPKSNANLTPTSPSSSTYPNINGISNSHSNLKAKQVESQCAINHTNVNTNVIETLQRSNSVKHSSLLSARSLPESHTSSSIVNSTPANTITATTNNGYLSSRSNNISNNNCNAGDLEILMSEADNSIS